MPREQINHAAPFTAAHDHGLPIHGESWPEPEVHISWTPAAGGDLQGHVQIAIDCHGTYLKHLVAEADDDRIDGPGAFAYSPSLDRAALNKLIRTLRRARDQAYGRDE